MIWLGVAESKGQVGGAAGSRSFVANYIVGSADLLIQTVLLIMVW